MKVLCVFGEFNYGNPNRGAGYEFMNLLPAFRSLGHEVVFFDSWDRSKFRGFSELNRRLLQRAEEVKPDLIFHVPFLYELWLETWQLLKDSGICTTVNWTTDDSWKYEESSRFLAPVFHAITTTYPDAFEKYQEDGFFNVFLTQWAADGDCLQPPLPMKDCRYQVSFVGTANRERVTWIKSLKKRHIDVACFGQGWERGPIPGSQIRDIIRDSAISLNFANAPNVWRGIRFEKKKQLKARVFEVPGAGGFLLTEWVENLEKYYEPEKEISVFHSLSELSEKINYYLSHAGERDAIACSGFERTQSEHTYERRLASVIAFAQLNDSESRVHPVPPGGGGLDWQAFERAARRHEFSLPLQVLRALLVTLFSIVFGRKRGERAARRFVFELSWRVLGFHTYTAAGLPGRMFYGES